MPSLGAISRGTEVFDAGLQPWEVAALESPPFPRSGHVLLGGAGGGRELRELLKRGFTVTAFEPSLLWRTARRIAGSNAEVLRGSYGDLVRAVAHGDGPLREVAGWQFDAIVLGWGSLPHIINLEEFRQLFAALRIVGPKAPVLLSFMLEAPPSRFTPLGTRLHRLLHRLGAPGEPCPAGLHFTRAGFMHHHAPDTLPTLAVETGYEVFKFDPGWYLAHAVWVPAPREPHAHKP